MAGISFTSAVNTASSTDTTSYASGSFTPAANDLLLAWVHASDTVAAGTMSDSQALGWTLQTSRAVAATNGTIYLFVAQALAANSSMTVTFDCTGDGATGAVVSVVRVAGGNTLSPIRQLSTADGTAGNKATGTFLRRPLSTDGCVAGLAFNSVSGVSPPNDASGSGWSELGDLGYAGPTTRFEHAALVVAASDETTVTWVSAAPSASVAILVEMYAAGVGPGLNDPLGALGFFGMGGS